MPKYSIRIIIVYKSHNTFNPLCFLTIQIGAVRVVPNNIFTKRLPKKANKCPVFQCYKKNTSTKPKIRSRKVSITMPATTGKYLLKIVFKILI